LAVLCTGCPVQTVMFWLFCTGCPILAVYIHIDARARNYESEKQEA
jgi:hypothetical protein